MTEPSPTLAASLALLTDDELARMTTRAYYGAAASWRALSRPLPNGPYSHEDGRYLRMTQLDDAHDLDEWHATLRAEQIRRCTP